jgi:hypothetical protein
MTCVCGGHPFCKIGVRDDETNKADFHLALTGWNMRGGAEGSTLHTEATI